MTMLLFPNFDNRRLVSVETSSCSNCGEVFDSLTITWRVPSNIALLNGQIVPDRVFKEIYRPVMHGVRLALMLCETVEGKVVPATPERIIFP